MGNLKQEKPDSYKTLAIYQKSECIYDVTYYFVNNFLSKSKDRTVDQMVQAARSCKQNIVEGYSDAEGSSESEHKLSVIAKGSLEELKEDYRDYLRNNNLEIWGVNHPKYIAAQPLCKRHNNSEWYRNQIAGRKAEDICNIALIIINQELTMLYGYIKYLNEKFLKEGGIKEQRYKTRLEWRKNNLGY
ncbi:MAG: four helix bundle suffix domain-containing protein [Prevotellaceae bacterium]|nr:four helix bundle suffix domain-containing protein [Prevotella sp.]MDD6802792.1 four helix bundle suffix domain-containing protein [Prevotellaceae bacterium]